MSPSSSRRKLRFLWSAYACSKFIGAKRPSGPCSQMMTSARHAKASPSGCGMRRKALGPRTR
eukprot:3460138-Pleurochrysis_carterae.AAC.1